MSVENLVKLASEDPKARAEIIDSLRTKKRIRTCFLFDLMEFGDIRLDAFKLLQENERTHPDDYLRVSEDYPELSLLAIHAFLEYEDTVPDDLIMLMVKHPSIRIKCWQILSRNTELEIEDLIRVVDEINDNGINLMAAQAILNHNEVYWEAADMVSERFPELADQAEKVKVKCMLAMIT